MDQKMVITPKERLAVENFSPYSKFEWLWTWRTKITATFFITTGDIHGTITQYFVYQNLDRFIGKPVLALPLSSSYFFSFFWMFFSNYYSVIFSALYNQIVAE